MPARKRHTPESAPITQRPRDEELARTERMYDFGNTPVLLAHPAVNHGAVVAASLTGYWVTRTLSREKFAVVDLSACLVLPSLDVQLPGDEAPRRVRPGTCFVGHGKVTVPPHLRRLFPAPNTGRVDPKSRFYSAVFGAWVTFPFASSNGEPLTVEASPLLWLNAGTVARGGALSSTSLGRIVGGVLEGLQLCCGCPPAPPAPPPARCDFPHPTGGFLCTKLPHPPGRGTHRNGFFNAVW
jgi:hypothetical protein